ncbi:MAG: hypothetical protein ACLQG3_06350 [Terracidiphilus sp.]
MDFVRLMWAVWGASLVFMGGVSIFAARLGRNREDQLFLADSSSYAKSEQSEISEKLSRIRPVRLTALGLAGAMTVLVVGYYLLDVAHRFGH